MPRDKKQEQNGFAMMLDGIRYVIYTDGIEGAFVHEIRNTIGMSVNRLLETLESDPDLDIIAAFKWIALRQAGQRVKFDDVAKEITYESAKSIDFVKGTDEITDPEDPNQ